MQNHDSYDAIIVGGGPAGSTAAAVLAQKGRRVLVLEREKFPRYHIGESLMPYCYFPLERIGVIDKMKASNFPKKYSVQFVRTDGKVSTPFYFFQHFEHEAATTWQVVRSEFDKMLLDNARDKGAQVIEEMTVRELIREDGAVVGVIGAHIPWTAVRDSVREAVRPERAEILLVSRDGTVIVGPAGLEGTRVQPLRGVLAAGQGVVATAEEEWPDGGRHLSVTMPVPGYRNMPGFGWSLILRQPSAVAHAPARETAARLLPPMLAASFLLLAAGALLARALARPLSRLASSAEAMALGRLDEPVPEHREHRAAHRYRPAGQCAIESHRSFRTHSPHNLLRDSGHCPAPNPAPRTPIISVTI